MLKFCLFLANIVVPFMLPVAWYWKVAAFFGIFYSVALVRAWFRVHANRRAKVDVGDENSLRSAPPVH
jgi:hypothetical protein